MTTVRVKLVALVLACAAPAIAGAWLRSRGAEHDMMDQVERRVNGTNRRFGEELDEDLACDDLALALSEHAVRFQQALAAKDPAGADRMVKLLGEAYTDRVIVAADATGAVLAHAGADRGVASLGVDTSPAFADLVAGKPLAGMIPIRFADGPAYALVSATPVRDGGTLVGSLAVITPMTSAYLERLEPKLNADLSLRVNEKVVAACADHPAPDLESHSETATLKEVNGKLFALKTFRPEKLQRPDMEVELTASRDVTELRDQVRRELLVHVGGLGLVLVIVLALALRFASRMGASVRAISEAAGKVKTGQYVSAPIVHSGDELESLAVNFNAMVEGLRERDRLRETFGRYVTRQVADHLMKGNVSLGGELVPVTVLFSDIRSFTSISETMEPRALLDFLNEYFTGMVESVMQHHGVVDKFIGDAIMAVFGAPVPHPDDPLHAIEAALDMRSRLAKINEGFRARGLPEIRTGIGLHSGQVVAGNMGHAERMEYTVIGDAVNLASRLEGMTKELKSDVILSEDLYRQVERHVEAEPLHKIKVKGRDQEVMVYRLIALKPPA
ncbi:MAG TPA: adenylate/guanylate cyclase domain-containing protein [Polyangiaceae bacterium]|nr:adenylate/guanylate cyclase domain-containing protein [Polyangiaceae bacterium]